MKDIQQYINEYNSTDSKGDKNIIMMKIQTILSQMKPSGLQIDLEGLKQK